MTPKDRAIKAAETMWSNDRASAWFGMSIDSVDEGYALLSLTVSEQHLNGLGMGHGGVTFALADSAFAFACNSRNETTVAQHNSISYLAPAKLGDVLKAEAKEVSREGRNGIYDVNVTNQSGTKIALFRGCSRTIRGQVFVE